jgi:hypothetical protein
VEETIVEQHSDPKKTMAPMGSARPTPGGVMTTNGVPGLGFGRAASGISPPPGMRPRDLSTADLVKQISEEVSQLAQKQIDLAKTELRANLRDEARMLGGLGVAGVGGVVTLNLVFMTAVLALGRVMPGWAAGLLMAAGVGLTTAIGGRLAWRNRVREPFARTRRTLGEDVDTVKQRLEHRTD